MASPTFSYWKCPDCDKHGMIRGGEVNGRHAHKEMGKVKTYELERATKEEYEAYKRRSRRGGV